MAFYVVTGKLGSGKSLVAVGRMRDYALAGRRVATNLDLYPEELLPHTCRETPVRVPDKPRAEDLEALGTGDGRGLEEYDESRFGLLVLDECASWLNSRQWNDPERRALLDWMLHARKRHWDVMLLIQDPNSLDKQMREAFMEHLVCCKRLDKLSIPGVTTFCKLFGVDVRLPKVHVARVYYGTNEQAALADRWVYKGTHLYRGYRTGQVFTNDYQFTADGEMVDMRASYSLLSAWHRVGRYQQGKSWMDTANKLLNAVYRPAALVVLALSAAVQGRSPWTVARRAGLLSREEYRELAQRRRDQQAQSEGSALDARQGGEYA